MMKLVEIGSPQVAVTVNKNMKRLFLLSLSSLVVGLSALGLSVFLALDGRDLKKVIVQNLVRIDQNVAFIGVKTGVLEPDKVPEGLLSPEALNAQSVEP